MNIDLPFVWGNIYFSVERESSLEVSSISFDFFGVFVSPGKSKILFCLTDLTSENSDLIPSWAES